MRKKTALLLFAALAYVLWLFMPETENAVVTRVIDGDTFVLSDGRHVRLLHIDTPEKGEACYEEAKQRLAGLTEHKIVKMERDAGDKDKYGRILRYISVNGTDVNMAMVKDGYARTLIIKPNIKHATEITEAERIATENRVGCLWS